MRDFLYEQCGIFVAENRKYLVENLDKEKCVGAYVDTIKSVIAAHQASKE